MIAVGGIQTIRVIRGQNLRSRTEASGTKLSTMCASECAKSLDFVLLFEYS